MKAEEKFFVVEGFREDFQWYQREEGYWLCCKYYDGNVDQMHFYKNKKEADSECEKYRESYRKAITRYIEGDTVWLMHDNHIHVGKITYLIPIGYKMRYKVTGCDYFFFDNEFFKTKEELLKYLEDNIQGA